MNLAVTQGRAVIAHHSKSFALASRLLPAEGRDDASIVYAWCRRADDAVDLVPLADQPRAVALLNHELAAIYAGEQPIGAAVSGDAGTPYSARTRRALAGMGWMRRGRSTATRDAGRIVRVAGVGLMMTRDGRSAQAALRHAAHWAWPCN
jgi:phytoene synthase